MAKRRSLAKANGTKSAGYPFTEKQAQYSKYTDAQLAFARDDANKAMEAMKGHDIEAEAWYADDVSTIISEILLRKRKVRTNPRGVTILLRTGHGKNALKGKFYNSRAKTSERAVREVLSRYMSKSGNTSFSAEALVSGFATGLEKFDVTVGPDSFIIEKRDVDAQTEFGMVKAARKNPRYEIPLEFEADLRDWAAQPRQANWTSYPQYAYDQFYRANPSKRATKNPEKPWVEYPPVVSTAGPFVPGMFPYGMQGRPAVYTNPRKGKKNPSVALAAALPVVSALSRAAAMGLSYSRNHSVLWALIHGMIGPAYLVYYFASGSKEQKQLKANPRLWAKMNANLPWADLSEADKKAIVATLKPATARANATHKANKATIDKALRIGSKTPTPPEGRPAQVYTVHYGKAPGDRVACWTVWEGDSTHIVGWVGDTQTPEAALDLVRSHAKSRRVARFKVNVSNDKDARHIWTEQTTLAEAGASAGKGAKALKNTGRRF